MQINRNDSANNKLASLPQVSQTITEDKDQLADAMKEGSDDSDAAPQFSDDMTLLQCFWLITKMASTLIVGLVLFLIVQLTNTYFIGNMNEPKLLAGVGMGNMLINVLCFAVIQGLNGALETLVS